MAHISSVSKTNNNPSSLNTTSQQQNCFLQPTNGKMLWEIFAKRVSFWMHFWTVYYSTVSFKTPDEATNNFFIYQQIYICLTRDTSRFSVRSPFFFHPKFMWEYLSTLLLLLLSFTLSPPLFLSLSLPILAHFQGDLLNLLYHFVHSMDPENWSRLSYKLNSDLLLSDIISVFCTAESCQFSSPTKKRQWMSIFTRFFSQFVSIIILSDLQVKEKLNETQKKSQKGKTTHLITLEATFSW